MLFKLATLLFLSTFLVSPTNNIAKEYHFSNKTPDSYVCKELSEEAIIMCTNSEQESFNNVISFQFVSIKKIKNVFANGSALLISSNIEDNNSININIRPTENDSEINLKFVTEKNEKIIYDLYFSKDSDGKCYTTNLSLDVVKRKASKELDYNIISFEDNPSYVDDSIISPTAIGVVGSVSGTLKWTDDSGKTHPLVGARVKVTISGSWWSSTTYTNSTGYYNISYNDIWYIGSGKPTVHIYADGESVSVSYNGIYEKTNEFSGSSGDFVYSYTFNPTSDGDMGKAMHLLQAGINYANYIEELNGGTPITKCTFNYPSNPEKGCYYDGANNVFISSKSNAEGFPTSYASWDVIGHEYGHHVQKCFGIAANPGGTHIINHNVIDDQYNKKNTDGSNKYTLNEAKDRGLRLAWGEGWPTFWSTVAQSTFSEDIKTINTVGDLRYSTYQNFYYDIDTYDAKTNGVSYEYLGDADEIAITSILYKLYSPTKDEYDSFSISDKELWTITVASKPHYFSQFVQALYNYGYNPHELGKLLSKYVIAISDITISNNSLDDYPIFNWSTYMGSEYLFYNNFDLAFVDSNGNEIFKKSNIISTGNKCQYALTKDEWVKIISSNGNTYYVYVIARQTNNYTSGNYYSEYFEFEKPKKTSETIFLDNIRYYEKSFIIAPDSAWYFTINFAQSGYKMIQTFSTADTRMWLYDSDRITIIDSDDDDGYDFNALIYKKLDANKDYVLKVDLYSRNSSNEVKLAIAPISGVQSSDAHNMEKYERIMNINTYHNFGWGSYLVLDHAKAVTWTPPVSGNYRISLTSEFDNYLYVIDPRKTSSLVLDVDYNDDYTGFNAQLSGYYEDDVTYFIIYSQYNPSRSFTDLDTGDDISLDIAYI